MGGGKGLKRQDGCCQDAFHEGTEGRKVDGRDSLFRRGRLVGDGDQDKSVAGMPAVGLSGLVRLAVEVRVRDVLAADGMVML